MYLLVKLFVKTTFYAWWFNTKAHVSELPAVSRQTRRLYVAVCASASLPRILNTSWIAKQKMNALEWLGRVLGLGWKASTAQRYLGKHFQEERENKTIKAH